MAESKEGQAVRRVLHDRQRQHKPWHRTDSTIAGAAITNCGRWMNNENFDSRSYGSSLRPNTLQFTEGKNMDLVFYSGYQGSRPCLRCWK